MGKWFAGLGLLALCVYAIPVRAADQGFDRTIPLASGGTLAIENANGSILVRGWDRNSVEIHAVKTSGRDADLDRVTIEVRQSSDRIEILTHYPQDQGVDVSVNYQIRVPAHVVLAHVVTVNGGIEATGIEGQGDLRTVNGNIEVYASAGSISARTTNGNIREELWSVGPSETSLETVNGSVILALSPAANGELEAQSMNGEVRSALPMTIASALSRGVFRGKLGSGGPPVHIHTVNGAIQIAALSGTI